MIKAILLTLRDLVTIPYRYWQFFAAIFGFLFFPIVLGVFVNSNVGLILFLVELSAATIVLGAALRYGKWSKKPGEWTETWDGWK